MSEADGPVWDPLRDEDLTSEKEISRRSMLTTAAGVAVAAGAASMLGGPAAPARADDQTLPPLSPPPDEVAVTMWLTLQTQIARQAASDENFRQRLLADPVATLRGTRSRIDVPEGANVQIMQNDASTVYFVLPSGPSGLTERRADLTDADLSSRVQDIPMAMYVDDWNDYNGGDYSDMIYATAGDAYNKGQPQKIDHMDDDA